MIKIVYAAIMVVVAFVLGLLTCILIHRQKQKRDQAKIQDAEQEALRIVNEAIKNGESKKREALVEAKEEILRSRNEYEKEVKERRADLQKQERRLQQKEENLDHKTEQIEQVRGAVEFDHVRFSYPDSPDKIIIKDFSAKVQPGQKVAIVGPTGRRGQAVPDRPGGVRGHPRDCPEDQGDRSTRQGGGRYPRPRDRGHRHPALRRRPCGRDHRQCGTPAQ